MPPEIEQLFREHRAGLVRLVERELHDRHDAEDVVQTAFLDAQRALERGTIPRNPRAWLAAIALNAGRRLRRRRLNAEPLEEYAAQESAGMPEIRAALASLPREQRAAVVYRDVLGLTYGETAEQMGTSVNSVTMLLHRGRRRLRQTLGLTAGGIGLWRWLKRAGMPQVAVAKGTAAAVVATGLATTGIVAAHVIAPVGTNVTAAAAATPSASSRTHTTGRTHDHARSSHSARDVKKPGGTHVNAVPAPAQGSSEDPSPTTGRSTTAEAASALLPSTLRLPTVSVPTLQVSTPAVTVAVSTPVATVTVATPTGTTVTVPTPITTVTLPIP